jgi:phosphoribosylanthranilate isomerase
MVMNNDDIQLLGDQPKYPLVEQIRVFSKVRDSVVSNPFIVGHLTHSHIEPDDFLQFTARGAKVLITSSGLPLHNLAARTSVNTVAERPILLWVYGADKSQDYILGEEIEAAGTGSDGMIYRSNELLSCSDPAGRLRYCNEKGLLAVVRLEALDHLDAIMDLDYKPNVVITMNDMDIGSLDGSGVLHVHLYKITRETPSLSHVRPGAGIVLDDISILPRINSELWQDPLVKVCGIQTLDAAECAVEAGADLIGMIMVPGRSRTVSLHEAKRISDYVHSVRRKSTQELFRSVVTTPGASLFEVNSRVLRAKTRGRPMVVGVFQNQPLDVVLTLQHELNLDMVQLHGSEPLEWCRTIPVPVIKRFTPGKDGFDNCFMPGYHYLPLVDGEGGGEGKLVDWTAIKGHVALGARFILAGGLNESNVVSALQTDGVFGVDVSGGVETNGVKDLGKIDRFVRAAKNGFSRP